MSKTEETQEIAAAKAGMDPKTARKYLREGRLPGESKVDRSWRTRPDPFAGVWEELHGLVEPIRGWKPKHCLSRYSSSIRESFPMGSCGLCSGGSSIGVERKGRARKYSFRKGMCLAG